MQLIFLHFLQLERPNQQKKVSDAQYYFKNIFAILEAVIKIALDFLSSET